MTIHKEGPSEGIQNPVLASRVWQEGMGLGAGTGICTLEVTVGVTWPDFWLLCGFFFLPLFFPFNPLTLGKRERKREREKKNSRIKSGVGEGAPLISVQFLGGKFDLCLRH